MRHYLIVANRTLTGEHLVREALIRHSLSPSEFHIVVPMNPAEEGLVWSEGRARAHARARLDEALERLRNAGIDVTGEVGDQSPLRAVQDAVRDRHFDEIIVSTLPPGVSRWIKLDLPNRLRRRCSIPVTHVIATREYAQ